jgi:hypothetical protein
MPSIPFPARSPAQFTSTSVIGLPITPIRRAAATWTATDRPGSYPRLATSTSGLSLPTP